MFVGIFSPSSYQYSLLALLWRERTEVRVAPSDFTLTLAPPASGRGEKSYPRPRNRGRGKGEGASVEIPCFDYQSLIIINRAR
jgi:hypothetical protein